MILPPFRGFITVTDSHYLHASLAHRIRGTYYFGCEMAAHFKTAVAQIVERIDHPAVDMVPYEESTHHPGVHHGNGLVGSPRNGAVKVSRAGAIVGARIRQIDIRDNNN